MLLLLLPSSFASVVDRIEAVVDQRIVTASDILFEGEFDPRDTSPLPTLERPDYGLRERLVDFAIIRSLAGDIEIFRPTNVEVNTRWEHFRGSWDPPEDYSRFLARWGIQDEDLRGFLYSRLVVEHYVARNLAMLGARAGADAPDHYPGWIADLRSRAHIRFPP